MKAKNANSELIDLVPLNLEDLNVGHIGGTVVLNGVIGTLDIDVSGDWCLDTPEGLITITPEGTLLGNPGTWRVV